MVASSESLPRPDTGVAVSTTLAIGLITLILARTVDARQAVLFLIGTGLGITLLHAAYGFSGAWRNFIRKRQGVTVRSHLLLFMLATVLFFPVLGQAVPGLTAGPALAPAGISVLAGAFLFGIGMELGSGCGSGTLYTVGGGHVNMLITLVFFIIGSLIGTAHLPWWLAQPGMGKISLIDSMGWMEAGVLQITVLAGLYLLVRWLELRRHGKLAPLGAATSAPFLQRLVFGPWPLSWGVLGLGLLSFLTLLVAHHPWSITFAFGLWGAKIFTALGGDVSGWAYWSSGYPARALETSVLADATSVMDFGIILGAMLAAGLAGSFAPAKKLRINLVLASVAGGLLLGYGARLAFGCNIGGMFGGIASGSLHGWLWLLAGFSGAIVGVRLRLLFRLDRPIAGASKP